MHPVRERIQRSACLVLAEIGLVEQAVLVDGPLGIGRSARTGCCSGAGGRGCVAAASEREAEHAGGGLRAVGTRRIARLARRLLEERQASDKQLGPLAIVFDGHLSAESATQQL